MQFIKAMIIEPKDTPYEKWMFYDYESTSSYPNAGRDYSKVPAITV